VRCVYTSLAKANSNGGICLSDSCEVIDSPQLAQRWGVPESWIRDQVRRRSTDRIPHVRFGKYVRFEWGCPELAEWYERRKVRAK
jgi:hypothetical protein